MRGPIDYIIVGFEGNKFDGSILKELQKSLDSGVIGLVALFVVTKDKDGNVATVNILESDNEILVEFAAKNKIPQAEADEDDLDEVADLIENNCTAAMLAVEHLWAIPLKKAILDANGVLVADGRIHPDAADSLDK